MEVVVYEDTKEVDAMEDEIVKKKRRVSFAQTQTIHVIPRHDDNETPPLLNSDPLPYKNTLSPASAPELATPRVSAEQQSATPRVSAVHDHSLHENSLDLSHFTSDMDTGHGSWVDDDSPVCRDSFDGLEDESGCFVHLRRISNLEDDDSIVNEVLNDDMTMDAMTFSRNLSQYLKSGTTFDLQTGGHSGQVVKIMNDSDTRSEEDSMALTKTGAPHWALTNPQDVSIHADDDKSDMSLTVGLDRVRPKKRGNFLTENKLSVSNAAEQSLPGFTNKSIHFSDKEKENFAPHKFKDGLSSNSPRLILDPHSDSEVSMSLSNTMDISLPHSLPRQSSVLVKIDGNSQTRPMSRRRSDITMQDTSFSVISDPNTTLPARNLRDLLLDHTDYTISTNLSAPRHIEDILHHLKDTSHIKIDQLDEECMVQLPLTKLQTLRDYLQFSCNMQPQVDWLSAHIQEFEGKLLNAKKRNTEVKSCNAYAQKLPEEASYAVKAKLTSKFSVAKKGWILWNLDAQRQVLSWLQESKDNLMKEVEEAKTKGQQVLRLKESCSQIAPKLELDEALDNPHATKNTTQLLACYQGEEKASGVSSQSIALENRHHQYKYKEPCDKLNQFRSKWNEMQIKVQSIASVHSQRMQTEKDKGTFENDLKASIRKLGITENLLQEQQVMPLKVRRSGRNSVIDCSLRGIYSQSFQFEGDDPLAQVQISKRLHPEAIEMAFPCMEAPLFLRYFSNDQCREPMELQHLYQVIYRTNHLCGSLVDVLEEIKFCRRNFGITCKFQIVNDEPLLSVTFLQCQRGIRVSLMFFMACVQRGVYPFDKKPADVQIQTFGLPASEVTTRSDIMLMIERIQYGFGRLARICSCIERTIQTSALKSNISLD